MITDNLETLKQKLETVTEENAKLCAYNNVLRILVSSNYLDQARKGVVALMEKEFPEIASAK